MGRGATPRSHRASVSAQAGPITPRVTSRRPAHPLVGAPPNADDFRRILSELKAQATQEGQPILSLSAGELHRLVGGYPSNSHRMPVCCSVMRSEMKTGDQIVAEPPKGAGASLRISYKLR